VRFWAQVDVASKDSLMSAAGFNQVDVASKDSLKSAAGLKYEARGVFLIIGRTVRRWSTRRPEAAESQCQNETGSD
jgi:hypothetical protein